MCPGDGFWTRNQSATLFWRTAQNKEDAQDPKSGIYPELCSQTERAKQKRFVSCKLQAASCKLQVCKHSQNIFPVCASKKPLFCCCCSCTPTLGVTLAAQRSDAARGPRGRTRAERATNASVVGTIHMPNDTANTAELVPSCHEDTRTRGHADDADHAQHTRMRTRANVERAPAVNYGGWFRGPRVESESAR